MCFLLLIPAALLAAILLVSYLAYRKAFYHSLRHREEVLELPQDAQYNEQADHMHALIEEMRAVLFERVEITARDGTRLVGRYIHIRDGAPLQIQFHGYHGGAVRDFCGGNKLSREAGHNSLVVDQRAHGESGACTITFGIKERCDCLDWVNYAVKRFGNDTQIILSGVSMGAATVLMATGLELPPQVKGVIADCPYSAPYDIIRKVCRDIKLPPRLSMPFISLGARLWGHFRLRDATAADAVRTSRVPILLIHGEDDRFVPCDMSREICRAATEAGVDVRLLTVPRAGHGLSFIEDFKTYRREVEEFLGRCLK